ncbi:MAG TPA: hypothetical protein VGF48_00565 [Thermoanaerobaculia bacterium]
MVLFPPTVTSARRASIAAIHLLRMYECPVVAERSRIMVQRRLAVDIILPVRTRGHFVVWHVR